MVIIRTNLVGPTSQMLRTKPQGHVPPDSGEDFKRVFYYIWVCWPSWSCDPNNLHKSWLTYCKESSNEI